MQRRILKDISQQLCIHTVPTKVSGDGLAYFTTADKQTSIAMQVSNAAPLPLLRHAWGGESHVQGTSTCLCDVGSYDTGHSCRLVRLRRLNGLLLAAPHW